MAAAALASGATAAVAAASASASASGAGASPSVASIAPAVASVRAAFNSGITRPIEWRIAQLNGIIKLVSDNREALAAALRADLGVNDFWIDGVELEGAIIEAKEAIAHLPGWVKPESVSTPILNLPGSSYVLREPFGVVCVISPWNYPVSLLLNPLTAALAAGNACVLKPSEVSVETSKVLSRLIPTYLDQKAITVVEGAVPETTELLKQRFDLIMYTGNGAVGRIVMKAAAEYLTPVILELGGKCPAIVADDADLKKTARRLTWGKWTMNNGQTCVSPDYVLASPKIEKKLVAELQAAITEFYGAKPSESKDISRMINERHCKRVADLLEDKKIEIVCGGDFDIKSRYIAPTVIRCGPDAKIMQDEIFGPVLPVLTCENLDSAISFVNSRDKPLALYVFSESSATAQATIKRTSSGGACINDCVMHVGNSNLPFGGVGPSGMGYYHGKWGFDSFSHKKAVFAKGGGSDPALRFAPYTPSKLAWLKRLRGLNFGALRGPLMVAGLVAMAAMVARMR